ncbi:MAG: lipocalin family protein [Lysobacterales bacterium]
MRLILILAALLLTGCASAPRGLNPITVVDELSMERYDGQWYVIANIPYFFERDNVAPRVVFRERDDGRFDDLYFYRKKFGGEEKTMEGVAWVPDDAQPGRLKTRFVWPFTFDYLVIKLDPEYRYVAIAHPSRKYGWIMAREAQMPDAVYQEYLQAFALQGYATDKLLKIPQLPQQLGQEGFQ